VQYRALDYQRHGVNEDVTADAPAVKREEEDPVLMLRVPSPPVALRGKNFATIAEFDVAEGECVPFVLTHGPSHLPPPAMVDWRAPLLLQRGSLPNFPLLGP
jgi:hypothetical protein